jgi:assimilatory nitrate reductase catalytic subunit
MFAVEHAPPAEEPGADFPFRLTTGRVVYHYLSGNQTRRLGFLNSQAPEPWVEIHPQAAGRLGISNDERVRVRTPRASMELKALVVPTIRPDVLFIPFHYGHRLAVNQLTNPAVEPTVKIPEYKVSAATVERLDQPEPSDSQAPLAQFTPESSPRMFPYTVGETKNLSTTHAEHH